MKAIGFVIFFAVFFIVYGTINFYIFIRGWQAIPHASPLRTAYLVVFLFFALSFIAGRFLERAWPSPVTESLVWIGSFWFAAMLYFFLTVVLLDIVRAVNALMPIYPDWVRANLDVVKARVMAGVIVLVSFILAAGHLNASFPRVRDITIQVSKKIGGISSLVVVSASDIHLGTIIGRSRLDAIIGQINSLNPDLVLLPGDIVDEDLGPVIRQNLGESLRTIRAKFGVLAITGNHEYIGGVEPACTYLTEHGITMLRDSAVRIGPGITVVGREDRSISQFRGGKRKPLEEIMAGVDRSAPIILMDHQPFGLDEAARAGVDLQVSGHTHHGQLWPLNFITEAIYELSWGYLRKGDTHYYVSSGVGTWGPPVRTGNTPEIVRFTLHFNGSAAPPQPTPSSLGPA